MASFLFPAFSFSRTHGATVISALLLSGCASPPRLLLSSSVYQPPESGPVCTDLGCAIGYVSPPAMLTVGDELQREFDRCLAASASADCVQQAFATVKKSQGLDERAPTGTVSVRKVPSAEKK